MKQINMKELNEFVSNCGEKTKLYLGCDSYVFMARDGTRMAKYTSVVVVHIDGQHGGKLFYEHNVERDHSVSCNKPSPRLMNEVYKVADLYLRMVEEAENCLDKEIEVHLDVNPEKEHKSSAVVKEAIGYIQGVCQTEAKVKPEAWAASTVADYF